MELPEIQPLKIQRYAKILSLGKGLPENVLTNQDIIDRYQIRATDRAVKYSLGIEERRWAKPEDTVEDLMKKAVQDCLDKAQIPFEKIDRILVARLVGDYNLPPSSIGILHKMASQKGIPAFDITSACSGFLHAMDLAIRYIDSGDDLVLVVGGGITTRAIQDWNVIDTKTIFSFGDALVAMLLGCDDQKHFFASYILTNSLLYDTALIPLGSSLLKNNNKDISWDMFNMRISDPKGIAASTIEYTKAIAEKLLRETGLSIEEISYFITSDQSSLLWEAQCAAIGIPKEKSMSLFHQYGNTIAAMPILNLNGLVESGKLQRDQWVMLMAHGAGASSAGMILKY